MPGKRQQGMSAYIAVTAAYWAFMLSDGALRMLVLLHFHTLGFSPVQLAYLFLLYELMGIVTNLSAGWLAARFGLTSTLYTGLILQIAALITLTQMNPDWPPVTSVLFVMAVQGLSGIAKDLAKMSSKSAVKLLAPSDDQGALFRWVALLTGSKNAVKGFGFLLGAALLGLVGFDPAMLGMAAALGLVLILIVMTMPSGLPGGTKGIKFCDVFSKNQNINRLSAARLFLFGARDTWFVVGIPIYFYAVLSDGTPNGDRAAFFQVGTFMAAWIIGYGIVQAAAPKLLRARSKGIAEIVGLARNWVAVLTLIPATLAVAVWSFPVASMGLTVTIVFGLLLFGAIFAVNSSIHSYLILAFSEAGRVTMDVGFYYMSNAAGRLAGTLLSGLSYQAGGLPACLATAAVMSSISWFCASRLAKGHAGYGQEKT